MQSRRVIKSFGEKKIKSGAEFLFLNVTLKGRYWCQQLITSVLFYFSDVVFQGSVSYKKCDICSFCDKFW